MGRSRGEKHTAEMMGNSDNEKVEAVKDFGTVLSEARNAQGYTVNDIFENIKIPEDVINAIEACDMAELPSETFTQGYIRSYARFLEISETDILQSYHQMLPGIKKTQKSRSSGSRSTKSNYEPLIKIVGLILFFAIVIGLIYGSLQSRDNPSVVEADSDNSEYSDQMIEEQDQTDTQKIEIEQNARISEDGELILVDESDDTGMSDESGISSPQVIDTHTSETASDPESSIESKSVTDEPDSSAIAIETEITATNSESIDETAPVKPIGNDTLSFYAHNGAWVEVQDANGDRVFYNMIPEGGSRTVKGRAPFKVFMGNAITSTVKINGIEIDYSVRIRTNNTVRFKVSSKNQQVVFH